MARIPHTETPPEGVMLEHVHREVTRLGVMYLQAGVLLAAGDPATLGQFVDTPAWRATRPDLRWTLLVERVAEAALAVHAIVLGTEEEAANAQEHVRRAHEARRIAPSNVAWMVLCLALAQERAYSRLVRNLEFNEREALCRDWHALGLKLGVPPSDLVALESYTSYREHLEERLDRARISPENQAVVLDACLRMPELVLRWRYRLLLPITRAVIDTVLPAYVRTLYGRERPAWQRVLVKVLARPARPLIPRRVVDPGRLRAAARRRRTRHAG